MNENLNIDDFLVRKVINIDTSGKDKWLNYFGQSINETTYSDFINEYNKLKDDDLLQVNITTKGGSLLYIIMIANVIVNHKGKTIARIPKYAFSGGTLIALVCDEIELCAGAALGPFDPLYNSIVTMPVKTLLPVLEKHKDTNMYCEFGYHYFNDVKTNFDNRIRKLLRYKYNDEQIDSIFEVFCKNNEHNFPIFIDDIPNFIVVNNVKSTTQNALVVNSNSFDIFNMVSNYMSKS